MYIMFFFFPLIPWLHISLAIWNSYFKICLIILASELLWGQVLSIILFHWMGHVFLFICMPCDYLVDNWVLDNYNMVTLEITSPLFPEIAVFILYVNVCVYMCVWLLRAVVVYSLETFPNYFFKGYFLSCTITKVSEFLSYVQLMFW